MTQWNKGTAAGDKAFKFWPASETGGSPGKNKVVLTDRGYEYTHPNGLNEVLVAARGLLSKSQSTDTTVGPTLTYEAVKAKAYTVGNKIVFTVDSNESLTYTGAPRLLVTFANAAVTGAGAVDVVENLLHTGYAVLATTRTKPRKLVFEYTVIAGDKVGQIESVAYNANGAVITDVGGGAVTPVANFTITGVVVA